jgi:hypothetical protein
VAVEGKQKENDGEKGDGSTTTRRRTTPFLFGTDKTLTEALDALFFVTLVSLPRYLVQSSDSMSSRSSSK